MNTKQNVQKDTKNNYRVLSGVITPKEITSIDNCIKSCVIENPEDFEDKFYVKIWFNYKTKKRDLETDGRKEFIASTKETLIREIQDFLKSVKDGWYL